MENDNKQENSTNESSMPKMKRLYKLRIYKDTEEPFNSILNATSDGFPKMVPGKKYTLRQIVELGDPKLWGTLQNYTRRCMGASFATKYYKGEIITVRMIDPNQSPIRYVND